MQTREVSQERRQRGIDKESMCSPIRVFIVEMVKYWAKVPFLYSAVGIWTRFFGFIDPAFFRLVTTIYPINLIQISIYQLA
jgi:hypothetical protein